MKQVVITIGLILAILLAGCGGGGYNSGNSAPQTVPVCSNPTDVEGLAIGFSDNNITLSRAYISNLNRSGVTGYWSNAYYLNFYSATRTLGTFTYHLTADNIPMCGENTPCIKMALIDTPNNTTSSVSRSRCIGDIGVNGGYLPEAADGVYIYFWVGGQSYLGNFTISIDGKSTSVTIPFSVNIQ